jgi:hypothetical protein
MRDDRHHRAESIGTGVASTIAIAAAGPPTFRQPHAIRLFSSGAHPDIEPRRNTRHRNPVIPEAWHRVHPVHTGGEPVGYAPAGPAGAQR